MATHYYCFPLFLIAFLLANSHLIHSTVTYDRKAILINGQRRILFSGSIHYPRSTPEMWEDLILKAKNGGLDVVETYVFWNVHEPYPGIYNFEGRFDLVRFIKTIQKAGLYANLRIGPYVCAEWNFGGFPVWLKYVPGISFRTDNEAFKNAMQGFTEKIVALMKSENLFESQGGPIILAQIENEYGTESKLFGEAGYNYMTWAANMAVGLQTGVPWVMCKEADAPDPVINTCNGFYCDTFSPNKPYKPTMWTEAWTGFLNLAVHCINDRFKTWHLQWHGGTNFGRTAGGPFITTSYDYDAPIDEYGESLTSYAYFTWIFCITGLLRQPKYGHLKELHRAIKMCEPALVSADPIVTSLGDYQQAHVYSSESGGCAAFLSNYDTKSFARVLFNNRHYNLPPWSISILPDCKNAVFNTAKVGVQTAQMGMLPAESTTLSWESYFEDISALDDRSMMTSPGLLEQINVTRDTSDYLWYITSVDISSSEPFLHGGELPTLLVQSTGHAVHVFINGQLSGSVSGSRKSRRFTYSGKVNLHAGTNKIGLLSVAVGLPNVGGHFETWNTGILGPVVLYGLRQGKWDLSSQKWTYKVGLKGEAMNLISPSGFSPVEWMQASLAAQTPQPLTWHKAYFDAPEGEEPLALDMEGMGKGQIWINGQSIGRYWTAYARGNCSRCNYATAFRPPKCQLGCGQPTQRWYHVPRSWLRPEQNLLVVFEEVGGNPSRISIVKRLVTSVCADVSEFHPTFKNWHITAKFITPKVHLSCDPGQYISSIKFASFGTPLGTCGSYQQGTCHAPSSSGILEKKCVGKQRCAVTVSNSNFEDPCPNMMKRLSVEAVCNPTTSTFQSNWGG